MKNRKNRELDSLIQNAVCGYQINIMDLSKVKTEGERAYATGEDVTNAVHTLLDKIAVKTA